MGLLKFSSVPVKDLTSFRATGLPVGAAIFKILKGIQGEWALLDIDMAEILQRTPSTYATWKLSESVGISQDRPSANDQIIFAFIDIYDLVSALFYREDQRRQWLREPNQAFGGVTPLEIMKRSSANVYELRDFLQRLLNP